MLFHSLNFKLKFILVVKFRRYSLFIFWLQADDEEEGKEKIPLVKEEPRGRRQPQKQGSAIDLDIGPPLEPNQVWDGGDARRSDALDNKMLCWTIDAHMAPIDCVLPYLFLQWTELLPFRRAIIKLSSRFCIEWTECAFKPGLEGLWSRGNTNKDCCGTWVSTRYVNCCLLIWTRKYFWLMFWH